MRQVLYVAAGALAAYAVNALVLNPTAAPVSVDGVVKTIERLHDRSVVGLRWKNQRDCIFVPGSLSAGLINRETGIRTGVTLNTHKPKGNRGMGIQETDQPWEFERPKNIPALSEVVLTVWHDCDGKRIKSEFFKVPSDDIF